MKIYIIWPNKHQLALIILKVSLYAFVFLHLSNPNTMRRIRSIQPLTSLTYTLNPFPMFNVTHTWTSTLTSALLLLHFEHYFDLLRPKLPFTQPSHKTLQLHLISNHSSNIVWNIFNSIINSHFIYSLSTKIYCIQQSSIYLHHKYVWTALCNTIDPLYMNCTFLTSFGRGFYLVSL